MAKNKKSKLSKKIEKLVGNNVHYYLAGAIILAFIASLYIGQNAAPGNPLYEIDRALETISSSSTSEEKIDFEIELAMERVRELKDIDINDKGKVERLSSSYNTNLDNILAELKNMSEDENIAEENFAKNVNDLIEIYFPAFKRDIKVELATYQNKNEAHDMVLEMSRNTSSFHEEVFLIGLTKIENDKDFNEYSMKLFQAMYSNYEDDIDFHVENVSMIVGQWDDGIVQEIQDMINDAREQNRSIINNVSTLSNSEIYEKFGEVEATVNKIGDKLVEESQKNLEGTLDEVNGVVE